MALQPRPFSDKFRSLASFLSKAAITVTASTFKTASNRHVVVGSVLVVVKAGVGYQVGLGSRLSGVSTRAKGVVNLPSRATTET